MQSVSLLLQRHLRQQPEDLQEILQTQAQGPVVGFLQNWLRLWLEEAKTELVSKDETLDIYRLQGKISTIRMIEQALADFRHMGDKPEENT